MQIIVTWEISHTRTGSQERFYSYPGSNRRDGGTQWKKSFYPGDGLQRMVIQNVWINAPNLVRIEIIDADVEI